MDAPVPSPRGRGVARAAKVTLILAGILALVGAESCAVALSGASSDALGIGIIGLLLLFGAGLVAVVGVALALSAALTRAIPVDPVTGAPLVTAHPRARALVLATAMLIGAGGLLTAVASYVTSRALTGGGDLGFAPAIVSAFGLVGLAAFVLAVVLVVLGSQGRLPRPAAAAAGVYLFLRLLVLVVGFVLAGLLPVVSGITLAVADLAIAAFLLFQARTLKPSATPAPPPRAPPP